MTKIVLLFLLIQGGEVVVDTRVFDDPHYKSLGAAKTACALYRDETEKTILATTDLYRSHFYLECVEVPTKGRMIPLGKPE